MKGIRSFIFTLFVFSSFLTATSQRFYQVGNIIYPYRAAPVIAQTGSDFYVLFNNQNAHIVDSVKLHSKYWDVKLELDSVINGHFEYDSYTKMYTNTKIYVTVPDDSPVELYDLAIYSCGEIFISKRSVKVVFSFPISHKFIHLSDPHVSRNWKGEATNGYSEELELLDKFIDVANIIAPDFVIVTGDLIHDYTRFNADSIGWGGTLVKGFGMQPGIEEKYRNYFEGAKGFRGIQYINAPVFSTTGNHDFYGIGNDDYINKSIQWNSMCGKRVHGLTFADTRILFADDYLGDPVTDIPDEAPMSGKQGDFFENFLKETGQGKLRIMAQHRHNRFDIPFLTKNRMKLVLNGHNHTPKVDILENTSILSIRSGTVCRSGEIKNWEKRLGFFRIFNINGDSFEYTEPLRFCKNPIADYNDIILNLTLEFKNENNGKYQINEALIKNDFEIDLSKCKIRFIMPQGEYKVENGKIFQIVNSKGFSIVDVFTDVKSNSDRIIIISNIN